MVETNRVEARVEVGLGTVVVVQVVVKVEDEQEEEGLLGLHNGPRLLGRAAVRVGHPQAAAVRSMRLRQGMFGMQTTITMGLTRIGTRMVVVGVAATPNTPAP